MLLLGLNFLPKPFQANTWPLCCNFLCWLGICKDMKAFSQTLQGWTLSLSCALSPYTDPILQKHDFPHKPALETCRSRCQHMSTSLHVLLKANMCLDRPFFVCLKFLPQWLHCSGKQGRVASESWYGASGAPDNSWCWGFVYLYNVVVQLLLGEKNLEAGAAGEWDKGTKGNFTNIPSSTTRLSSITLYLLFPSISYLSSSSSFFSSSSSSCSSYLRRFGKPPGPASSPAGTFRTGTGVLFPQVPKYWQLLNYSQGIK